MIDLGETYGAQDSLANSDLQIDNKIRLAHLLYPVDTAHGF
jgi:hypothetical protein